MFDIYKNKKVLVTGHTGFKGSWLVLWLESFGADVLGYSLEPETKPSLFDVLNLKNKIKTVIGDIRDREKLEKTFNDFKPEIVFHLAAQPLVRRSYFEPVLTYETNVIGSLNVLESARKCQSVRAFVNVTTDKCYENKEIKKGYTEDQPMGGYDMYSSSKACVEILSASYKRCFLDNNNSFDLATARAGNVIGGGDWADDRLVPDCIRAIENGQNIEIRNPMATRPWQHVLEPLSGYLTIGEKLLTSGKKYAQSYNLGPEESSVLTVEDVAKKVIEFYGKGELVVHKKDNLHEANLLMLNINKAKEVLGWKPVYNADEALKKTTSWYKKFYKREEMLGYTLEQIKDYEREMDRDGKAVKESC